MKVTTMLSQRKKDARNKKVKSVNNKSDNFWKILKILKRQKDSNCPHVVKRRKSTEVDEVNLVFLEDQFSNKLSLLPTSFDGLPKIRQSYKA